MHTLLVETDAGLLVRQIQPASPLPGSDTHGDAVELSVRDAGALWGMPDFVYDASEVDKGGGRRELGDAFIIVEGLAAIVQVKGRASPTGDVKRETAWVKKQVERANKQAAGTLRSIQGSGARLRSARGTVLDVVAGDYEWLSVVVVEHNDPPAEIADLRFDIDESTVLLLRAEWEFLFEEIRSTTGVLFYLKRAMGVGLGEHAAHYYTLAQRDEATEPAPLSLHSDLIGAKVQSTPQLPVVPAGADDGQREVLLRAIMEDAAVVGLTDDSVDELARFKAISSLDRFPLVHRPELCDWIPSRMIEMKRLAAEDAERVFVASRNFLVDDEFSPRFVVVVASGFASPWLLQKFSERIAARHLLFDRPVSTTRNRTLGILVTPAIASGSRLWDTTVAVLEGELSMGKAEAEALVKSYPLQPHEFG